MFQVDSDLALLSDVASGSSVLERALSNTSVADEKEAQPASGVPGSSVSASREAASTLTDAVRTHAHTAQGGRSGSSTAQRGGSQAAKMQGTALAGDGPSLSSVIASLSKSGAFSLRQLVSDPTTAVRPCVCVCVCVCTCVRVYMCACVLVCVYAWVSPPTHL